MRLALRSVALASVLAIGGMVGFGASSAQANGYGYGGYRGFSYGGYSRGYGGVRYGGYGGYSGSRVVGGYRGYGGYGGYGRGYGAPSFYRQHSYYQHYRGRGRW